MNMNIRRIAGALALAVLAWAGAARAETSADSITITINPTASYLVAITTTATGANLGAVALNTSTNTVAPSTVTVDSTYAYTGLKLAGYVRSPGSNPWSLVSTNSQTTDGLAAWVVFTDTSVGTAPATSVLTSSNALVGTAQQAVGATGGTCPTLGSGATHFELQSGSGIKHMECHPTTVTDAIGGKTHMYLYLKLPPSSTDGASAQNVTFTLYAGIPL